ncbi:MAG: peptidylprolyl isomerase [Chloroflexia bacterium]|nr:peptidylprolyl isomerase [Chloroflexia bacterium]
MAKKKRTLSKPSQRMTKRERSRWEREQRLQRNLIIILAAVGLVSVVALVFGWYWDRIRYPNQVIVSVNGEPVRREQYWNTRRLDLITEWNEILNQIEMYNSMGITLTEEQIESFRENQRSKLLELTQVRQAPIEETTLQSVIEEVLIRQGAADLGISLTEQEVNAWLIPDASAGSDSVFDTTSPTGTQPLATVAPTLSANEREQRIEEQLGIAYENLADVAEMAAVGQLGFSRRDYIDMVRYSARTSLLQQRAQQHLLQDLPQTAEQVHASHILLKERLPRAQEALNQLSQGTPFAELVVEYSDDAASRDLAGDLGWVTLGDGTLSPAVQEAALALSEPGQISEVVSDEAGAHILQLVERSGDSLHLRHILIPANRRPVAIEVLNLLQVEGRTFDQVAREYSEDTATAATGGDLGWIEQGDGTLSTVVDEVAFSLNEPNQISDIVEDEAGYHILQLVETDPESGLAHLRHILIRNGQGLAEQVLRDLRAQVTDFAEAVIQYSADATTVEKAGDWGWLNPDQLPPTLAEAVAGLNEPGQTSDIIEDESGYYILQLLERDDATGQVHLRGISLKRAVDLLEEIRQYILAGDQIGGRFLEMALKYSEDTGSRQQGGDLGWFSRGTMVTEFEEAAFSLEPGQLSEIVETQFGYHLIWVQEYDAEHPLDEETLEQQAQQAFQEWLQGLQDTAVIERTHPPTATPTVPPPPTAVPPTAETES